MQVIRNMRVFRYRLPSEFPCCLSLCTYHLKLELLYIAGLSTISARRRRHSELGAVDAAKSPRHGLNDADTELVCWLVEQHLFMSSVAQRQTP